jgi:hypothetical protein
LDENEASYKRESAEKFENLSGGEWNDRMLTETIFSLLSHFCRLKNLRQRA